MDRGTVETALMSPLPVRTDTALLVSSSVTMGTAQVHISYVIPSQIAMTDQMKILYFALITSVKLINGNVPINDVSQKRGSVIERMTVVTTQMKILLTVQVGPVPQANLNVTMAAASQSPGSVMWMMIVVITLMSRSTNAWALLIVVTTTHNSAVEPATVAYRCGQYAMGMMTAETTVMNKAVRR